MSLAAYLSRLGLPVDLPATYDGLVALHRAHLLTVPYDNLEIMLGRPQSVVPADSLARIAATGRGGYCFHQNAALETALHELGFAVERHHGHVWTRPEHRDQTELTHLVLRVSGLATDANPGGRWWVDVGLGEGFLEPLRLVEGTYVEGPFTWTVSDVRADGWSFRNDPAGSFTGLEVRPLPVDVAAVDVAHAALSTAPTGAFTRMLVVQRREIGAVVTHRGCVRTRVDATGPQQTDLTSYDDWRASLAALGVGPDVDEPDLRRLFDRSLASHRAWDAAGRL